VGCQRAAESLRAAQGDERQHLVGEVGRQEGRLAGRVIGRDDLDHVEADEVDPGQATNDRQRIVGGGSARFGRAGAGCEGRIDDVDVEADERPAIPYPLDDLRGGFGRTDAKDVFGRQVLEPEFASEARPVLRRIDGAAQPYLDLMGDVDQALLDRAAHPRAVVVLLAEVAVPGVGVGVEVDDRHGAK
jgi:hypothetical protein